jgi:acetolactate synthase I/III small subunit
MSEQTEIPQPRKKMAKRHTISLKAVYGFNALSRISGLFSGRGFSIDSISFGDAEEPETSRVTITTSGDERIIEQITFQLEKLVDVVEVKDLTYVPHMERELALVKVSSNMGNRSEIMQIANVFRAKVIDISPESMTLEITGSRDKVDASITMLEPYGLREVARTGTVALPREYQPKD